MCGGSLDVTARRSWPKICRPDWAGPEFFSDEPDFIRSQTASPAIDLTLEPSAARPARSVGRGQGERTDARSSDRLHFPGMRPFR